MDIYERIRRYEQSEQLLLALRAESSDKLALWMSYGGNIKELEEYQQYLIITRDLYAVQTRLTEMRALAWQR